jgi:hypothetical protein
MPTLPLSRSKSRPRAWCWSQMCLAAMAASPETATDATGWCLTRCSRWTLLHCLLRALHQRARVARVQ